ncbi:MAG TPA: nitrite/sulfite reductase, partial [Pseudonocardia sp.]|nr:nitrite/sulfite reductase [Pseudonocardia sp.]
MPPTTPAARTAPAKRKRGEGQWKLGYREPLNPNERTKRDDDGLNVRARIENIYAKRGFDSIDPADLRGRMRWWGLYTQRKPGIDGGRTAALEPEELDDRYFMLRVRIDGGALTTDQLRLLGEISRDHARDTADVTDRQNIQYHWIEIEDMPAIWQKLESQGLITTEACGDTPRVNLGSPVAGNAAGDPIDPRPAIDAIRERYIGSKEFSNLPRKFKTAISWQQDVAHEVNDVSFIGVEHPEHGPGFDVWAGIVSIFRDYGYRRLRHRARIKFLVADWGAVEFRRVLEEEYLHRPLVDGPAPAIPAAPIDHVGVHKQADGRNYVGVAPASGRVSGTTLIELADAVEEARSTRVRLTPQQKIVVLD